MGKRSDLIELYTRDLAEKCGLTPDVALLEKVVIGCGPAVYRPDATLVAGSDPEELERVRKNFLIKKLGLDETDALMEGIDKVMEVYGRSNRTKHRAVVYYLLACHFGKEGAYD